MLYFSSPTISGKQSLILMSLIAITCAVDSKFIDFFYATDFGAPGALQLLIFISLAIVASIINSKLLLFSRSNIVTAKTGRSLLFRIGYVGTSAVQYTLLIAVSIMIFEMVLFHAYHKILFILVIFLSHVWAIAILGVLSVTFMNWFRATRSPSILIYGFVFLVVIFLILVTTLLLAEQFTLRGELIFPQKYLFLILTVTVPSPDVAFIFGLGSYVLPLMLTSSWILTVMLLKPYSNRIGKKTFWLIVALPLLYQLFLFIVRDTNLLDDTPFSEIKFSKQVQFFVGLRYVISGLFFAFAFLVVRRKVKRDTLKNYLLLSSLGVLSLFSSIQPGLPFYIAYPPYGTVTVFFLGLSSYLLLAGMLGCAAYVSRDRELRREIYKGLEVDYDLFNKMGIGEMQREMEKRIMPLVGKVKLSDEMREQIDPDKEDVRKMINEVLNEIRSRQISK